MKRIMLIVAMLINLCTLCAEDNDAMGKLQKFFNNIATFEKNYTQEKVYLHLDNNGYFPGEKIWFKAYVFKASTLLPTDMSKVLYVDLLTPDGSIIDHKCLPVYNGRTYGDFDLDYTFITGFYEIRAYTRAMTNWDAAYYGFSRVVPVFDVPNDSINYTNLSLKQPDGQLRYIMRRKMPDPLTRNKVGEHDNYILSFFPEGGHIIKGLENRVAFKLTNSRGIPVDTTFTVEDTEGNTILTASTFHEGMGRFTLPAGYMGGCVKLKDNQQKKKSTETVFDLPVAIEDGCVMSATMDDCDSMHIRVSPNATFENQLLGVSVTCRGVPCYFDTLHVAKGSIEKVVPRKQLKDGIQQITLFTPDGEILNECLTWVEPLGKPLCMEMKQNENAYSPFSPIVLDFTLKDSVGNPLQGDFSLSVQDRAGMLIDDGASLRTDMLLCSDLKGYIHHPEYYFEKKDTEHQEALDLLLKVQGWRRYEWKEMAGVEPFKLKQPMEDRQVIDGKVIDRSSKKRGISGVDVSLFLINSDRHFCKAMATTDSLGKFYFLLDQPLKEDVYAYLKATVKNKKQKDKAKNCYITLNRTYRPNPRQFEPFELNVKRPEEVRDEMAHKDTAITTFVWQDTLPHVHYLPEARVKEKKRFDDRPGRKNWGFLAGEEYARKYSAVYFNLDEELQDFLDEEGYEPDYNEFLAYNYYKFQLGIPLPSDWDLEPSRRAPVNTIPFSAIFGGVPFPVVVDNVTNVMADRKNLSDYHSLYVVKGYDALKTLLKGDGKYGSSIVWNMNVPHILLYSVPNYFLANFKKGVRTTVINGYSGVSDFYSPNYRTKDAPLPSDRRRTLYWNPSMTTDKNGKANVILFNNFRNNTHLHVDVQGIAVNGQMFELAK